MNALGGGKRKAGEKITQNNAKNNAGCTVEIEGLARKCVAMPLPPSAEKQGG
jgi:hypothetical protein